MSTEDRIFEAYQAARSGNTEALRNLTEVRWCVREVARFGDPLRVEAFVVAGAPISHTLSIVGGWGLADSERRVREFIRLPGASESGPNDRSFGRRIAIADLPINLTHLAWDATDANGTWSEPGLDGSNDVVRDIVALLTLRWDIPGEPAQAVQLDYALSRKLRFVREWPDDYPAAVEPGWSDEPVRLRAALGSPPDHHIVSIDLARPLEVPVAWEVTVRTVAGFELMVKRIALNGNEDGVSFLVPTEAVYKDLRVTLEPSREVARDASYCIDRFATHRVERLVAVESRP